MVKVVAYVQIVKNKREFVANTKNTNQKQLSGGTSYMNQHMILPENNCTTKIRQFSMT